jgi:hypothetical protein
LETASPGLRRLIAGIRRVVGSWPPAKDLGPGRGVVYGRAQSPACCR